MQPTLAKLGDNKMNGRNHMVTIGLFNPARYKITAKTYLGYNIEIFKNHFREIKIIKHRDGTEGVSSPMLFYGKINRYKELPLPEDVTNLEKVYDVLNKI